MEFTEKLTQFIENMRRRKLDSELRVQFQKALLDYLSVVITGSQTDTGQKVAAYFKQYDYHGTSSIVGHESKLSAIHAAFVNATSAHCLDFDDGHTAGSVHPGTVIFPVVFALAEKEKVIDIDDIIKAVIVGYEVTIHVSSVIHPASRNNGYHNTSAAGVFGAAAATSYMLNAGPGEIAGAFGNALSFAGGTFSFLKSGSEIKRIHPGIAARDGIISAELALVGLPGPDRIFEKDGGAFDVLARGNINETLSNKMLGQQFEFMNIYFKPYPACRHLHVVMDALEQLKEQHQISFQQIKQVKIGVNQLTLQHIHKDIYSMLDAQMSLPYSTAVVLIDEAITVDSFNLDRPDLNIINDLMDKVDVYFDEDCELVYPQKRKAKIVLELVSGDQYSMTYDGVKGEPPNVMLIHELEQKLRTNCQQIIRKQDMDAVLDQVHQLDLKHLMKSLS